MKQTKGKDYYILGIDTSCDDTSVAIVKNTAVLSNIISSQVELHRKYGGVVPMIAKLEHQGRIDFVIAEAFKIANKNSATKITWEQIDAIAVTYGPGLAIALEVGIAKAKELCLLHNKKLIAVNHMEGHLWSSIAANSRNQKGILLNEVQFPALGVLISGGHTELILVKDFGVYEIIGQTLDDAMGEAFDKVARMLGLGYPGGAVLSEMAKLGDSERYKLPVPLARDPTLNFSYSGLKTAVYYQVNQLKKDAGDLDKTTILNMAASFEKAAISALIIKFKKALAQYPVKMILVGGGVSASVKVRQEMRKVCAKFGLVAHFPSNKKLFMDNGAMIGIIGYLKALRGEYSDLEIDRQPRAEL